MSKTCTKTWGGKTDETEPVLLETRIKDPFLCGIYEPFRQMSKVTVTHSISHQGQLKIAASHFGSQHNTTHFLALSNVQKTIHLHFYLNWVCSPWFLKIWLEDFFSLKLLHFSESLYFHMIFKQISHFFCFYDISFYKSDMHELYKYLCMGWKFHFAKISLCWQHDWM